MTVLVRHVTFPQKETQIWGACARSPGRDDVVAMDDLPCLNASADGARHDERVCQACQNLVGILCVRRDLQNRRRASSQG